MTVISSAKGTKFLLLSNPYAGNMMVGDWIKVSHINEAIIKYV